MYDFDNDGFITPEDIRIMMSYMPFNRNVQVNHVQSIIDTKGMDSLSFSSRAASPTNRQRQKKREGMYQEEEGKNVDYKDRISDQEEIKQFTDNIFNNKIGGVTQHHMGYKQYDTIIKTISSEMFYSLMAVLHEKLPCATGYFRMRKKFKDQQSENDISSPIRSIASPKMIRGLSIPKAKRQAQMSEQGQSPKFSPDIRIKNVRNTEANKTKSILNSAGQANKKGIVASYKDKNSSNGTDPRENTFSGLAGGPNLSIDGRG